MTTKNLQTLMMMTMIVFNKQQHISRCPDKRLHLSEYKSQAELNNHSLACGWCWLRYYPISV